ncbi:MAG: hypothetical protein JEZ11_03230 [Desulfobacterales bacterium]|nr:hypothetical protein [Desulfobacterales bacterium]
MIPDQNRLEDLVDVSDPAAVLAEIKHIGSLLPNAVDLDAIETVHADTIRLFGGDYPGYRASNTKYHDLEHTHAVALAAMRLMHGCALEGMIFEAKDILLGIVSTYFHDVGLIQTEEDTEGTGAKYTVGHEERSIAFMDQYVQDLGFPPEAANDCAQIIRCTILQKPLTDIDFRNPTIKALGQIVGTADLLAQMADRQYLEKLLLLYEEFEEAGLPGYGSEIELLKKTKGFYESVVRQRLSQELGDMADLMVKHFNARWGLKQDFYARSISANLEYLARIMNNCLENPVCYLKTLRRGGISRKKASG